MNAFTRKMALIAISVITLYAGALRANAGEVVVIQSSDGSTTPVYIEQSGDTVIVQPIITRGE